MEWLASRVTREICPVSSTPETGGHVCHFHHPTVLIQTYLYLLFIAIFISIPIYFYYFNKKDCNKFKIPKYMSLKETGNYEIDKLDKEIISILMKDATVPFTEIAKKLIVSGGTIHVRMNKLKKAGIVKGSQLIIDPSKIGYDITAFIGVYLEKGSLYHNVAKDMKKLPEVVEIYYTTGSYSMFAKIICMNTQNLREVLNEKIQSIKGIQRTETFISLEESIKRQVKIL
jgi:Lrp/AsnC family transcriptional regulator for asnA, asnC and gidA